MARNKTRIAPGIEGLEKREVLSSAAPTDQAQYMLEVMNLVRTNPTEGAKWVTEHVDSTVQSNLTYYGINIQETAKQIASARPQQPLAWDGRLASAAQQHSDDMAAKGYQSHDQPNAETRTIDMRLDRAGYNDRASYGENAFAYVRGSRDANSEKAVDNALQAFLIDWGVDGAPHRKNILNTDKNDDNSAADVGIGIADVSSRELLDRGFGPKVVTQVFGRQANSKAQIVGVVYEDADQDGRFSFREGKGDISVVVEDLNGRNSGSLATWNTGGYQLEVDPGTYRVQALASGKLLGSQVVQVGTTNVKVDFKLNKGDTTVNTQPTKVVTTPPVAPPTVKITPVVTPKAPTTNNKLAFSVPQRVASTPTPKTTTPPVVTDPAPISKPALDGYAVAVNITQPVTAPNTTPVVTDPAPASQPVSNDGQAVVEKVLGTGLFTSWSSSRIVWGQGWRASQNTD